MLGAKQRLWLFGLLFFCAGADQIVKSIVKTQMRLQESIALLPGVFQLTFVYNKGAAFSLFEHSPSLLTACTVLLFFVIAWVALKQRFLTTQSLLGFGLVLGGALGNICDRLFSGQVVDYFDFILIRYPVFNLADSFIFIGVIILLFEQLRPPTSLPTPDNK